MGKYNGGGLDVVPISILVLICIALILVSYV